MGIETAAPALTRLAPPASPTALPGRGRRGGHGPGAMSLSWYCELAWMRLRPTRRSAAAPEKLGGTSEIACWRTVAEQAAGPHCVVSAAAAATVTPR